MLSFISIMSSPFSFRALRVSEPVKGQFVREIIQRSTDALPAAEVLIQVHYAALNYKDALSATGNKGVTRNFPHTPGIDAAGLVTESAHPDFKVGAPVLVTGYDLGMNTDGGFGVSDYDYGIATGHVSAYYDFGNGFLGQLDMGRYLAGDVGATLSLDREFGNGIKVGAFATLTSASAEEFGEGSFDKGIRMTIPLNWVLGQSNRTEISPVIRPLQRDGGARTQGQGDRPHGR